MKILFENQIVRITQLGSQISVNLTQESEARILCQIDSHDNRLTATHIELTGLPESTATFLIDSFCTVLKEQFGGKEFVIVPKEYSNYFLKNDFFIPPQSGKNIRFTTPQKMATGLNTLLSEGHVAPNFTINNYSATELATTHTTELTDLIENCGFSDDKVRDYFIKGALGFYVMYNGSISVQLFNGHNQLVAVCRVATLGKNWGYVADTWVNDKFFNGSKLLGMACLYNQLEKICAETGITQLLCLAPPQLINEFEKYFGCEATQTDSEHIVLARFAGPQSELAKTFKEAIAIIPYHEFSLLLRKSWELLQQLIHTEYYSGFKGEWITYQSDTYSDIPAEQTHVVYKEQKTHDTKSSLILDLIFNFRMLREDYSQALGLTNTYFERLFQAITIKIEYGNRIPLNINYAFPLVLSVLFDERFIYLHEKIFSIIEKTISSGDQDKLDYIANNLLTFPTGCIFYISNELCKRYQKQNNWDGVLAQLTVQYNFTDPGTQHRNEFNTYMKSIIATCYRHCQPTTPTASPLARMFPTDLTEPRARFDIVMLHLGEMYLAKQDPAETADKLIPRLARVAALWSGCVNENPELETRLLNIFSKLVSAIHYQQIPQVHTDNFSSLTTAEFASHLMQLQSEFPNAFSIAITKINSHRQQLGLPLASKLVAHQLLFGVKQAAAATLSM